MPTTHMNTSSVTWIIASDYSTIYTCSKLKAFFQIQSTNYHIPLIKDHFPILEELLQNDKTVFPVILNYTNHELRTVQLKLQASKYNFNGLQTWILEFSQVNQENSQDFDSQASNNTLFEDSPIPIWDEDFSAIKTRLDHLKSLGIASIRDFLTKHPDELIGLSKLLRVNRINNAVVELNEAETKYQVLTNFRQLTTSESNEYILQQMEAIWNGEKKCEFDAKLITMKGNTRYVNFKWTVVDGYEHNYSRVFLTTTDLTRRIKEENLFLQQANKEKETLLKEIHHRVKNNLQIITSLIRLQLGSTQHLEARQLLEVSLSRISSIASVHELLYKSNQFASIDYREYIQELVSSLINTMIGDKEIQVDIEVDDVKIPLEMAIPLGLLINEILTNSIKHAFPSKEKDRIFLKLSKINDEQLILSIGDNGKGFDPEIHLNSSTETLGISLIENLAEQLSGILELMPGEGTTYELRFHIDRKL
jgi:two-component sensor histidine kinase